MARVRVNRHGAVFPPGYVQRARWLRLDVVVARHCSRMRHFLFAKLPYGRLRTHIVARYFQQVVADMSEGAFENLTPSVHPDAEVELWNFGTYRGKEGWKTALSEWLQTFDGPVVEMHEYIDPGNGEVLFIGKLAGTVRGSGLAVERELAFRVKVEGGMAVEGRLYESKGEALEAVGLRE